MSDLKVKVSHCPICNKTIKWDKDVGTCECPGKKWKPITLEDGSSGWRLLPAK